MIEGLWPKVINTLDTGTYCLVRQIYRNYFIDRGWLNSRSRQGQFDRVNMQWSRSRQDLRNDIRRLTTRTSNISESRGKQSEEFHHNNGCKCKNCKEM